MYRYLRLKIYLHTVCRIYGVTIAICSCRYYATPNRGSFLTGGVYGCAGNRKAGVDAKCSYSCIGTCRFVRGQLQPECSHRYILSIP